MFKRILVPVDFTQKNRAALETACLLAADSQSCVILLHVIEKIDYLPANELKIFYRDLQNRAREKLNVTASLIAEQDVRVQQKLVRGHRVRAILEFARKRKIDLIVMSSHKIDLKKPAQGWGTISYRVAILSQCPVLLVK